MNKQDFMATLRKRLSEQPTQAVEERLAFYSEIIDDRMEDGLSEEEAVAAIGTVDEIAAQILSDMPQTKARTAENPPKEKWQTWQILLLVLGAPVWFSLLIAALSIVISLYASVWSVIISLWAVFATLIGCAVSGIAAGIGLAGASALAGGALICAGVICAGLAILLFFGCRAVTRGSIYLTRTAVQWVARLFCKKESAK